MPLRSLSRAMTLAAFLALSLTAMTNSAAAFQCEAQVNQALQEHGVNQSDVSSVNVVRRSGGGKSADIYSLDAWIRLNSCSNGAVIVNLTKYCLVKNVYTTGDCRVGSMPSY